MDGSINPIPFVDPIRSSARESGPSPVQQSTDRGAAPAQRISDASVDDAVRRIGAFVRSFRRDLEFSVDRVTGQTVIRVRDADTDQLIRQIPPEEILAIARHLEEAIGVLFRGEA